MTIFAVVGPGGVSQAPHFNALVQRCGRKGRFDAQKIILALPAPCASRPHRVPHQHRFLKKCPALDGRARKKFCNVVYRPHRLGGKADVIPHGRSTVTSSRRLNWPADRGGFALHFERRTKVLVSVVPDTTYAGMWRVRWPDGCLSDMTNLTRAKDAVACFMGTEERRQRGRHSPSDGRLCVKTDSWGKGPAAE